MDHELEKRKQEVSDQIKLIESECLKMLAELPNRTDFVPEIDVEAELFRILQEEIWNEITAETGKTRDDYDNEIVAEIVKLADKNNKA